MPMRRSLFLIACLLAVPILYLLTADLLRQWHPFDRAKDDCSLESIWGGDGPGSLWDRAQERMKSFQLVGKSKDQVLSCFGEPRWFATDDPNHWIFEVRPFGLMWDAIALSIQFDGVGTAKSARLWEMPEYHARVNHDAYR